MADQEEIRHQQSLLQINRARLKVLSEQLTKMGTFAPPYMRIEADEARANITRIKGILRGWNVSVDNLQDEDAPDAAATVQQPSVPPESPPRSMPASLRQVKQQTLSKRLENRMAEYQAINQQIDNVVDEGQRVRLQHQAANLEQEISQIESDLRAL